MANKSFTVSYLIKARDKFSEVAKKIARAHELIRSSAKRSNVALDALEAQRIRSLKKVSLVSLDSLKKVEAQRTRTLKKISLSNVNDLKKIEAQHTLTTNKITKKSGLLMTSFKRLAPIAATYFSGRAILGTGMSFEDRLADLSAITGAAGKDLDFLKNKSFELSRAAVVSQSEVLEAFKLVASAKPELLKNGEALASVTQDVLLLSNASGVDLATAAKVTAESLNQFGADASQANRYVNVLAAGSKYGSSEVAETGVAVLKAGAAAKSVGIEFEQLNAAIQVLAKSGFKAELAGTGLKTALLKLEASGIDAIRPSVVGLEKALSNLKKAGLDIPELQKLFGLEAYNVGYILMDNVELLNSMEKQITNTSVAQEQAAIRMNTFSKKWQALKLAVSDKLIQIFLQLAPALTAAGDKFIYFFNQIKTDHVTIFIETLKVLFLILKNVYEIGTKLFNMFKGIVELIAQLAAAVVNLDFSNFKMPKAWDKLKEFTFSSYTESAEKISESFFNLINKKMIDSLTESYQNPNAIDQVAKQDDLLQSAKAELQAKLQDPAYLQRLEAAAISRQQVAVDMRVGLDKGLRQSEPAQVRVNNMRRNDVGLVTP